MFHARIKSVVILASVALMLPGAAPMRVQGDAA